MINNLRCRRGFSVTELLVGFGLLSVLVVGAAEGMRLYIATNKHVKVQEQVLDVRANLRGRLNCDNTLTPVTVAKCDGTQYVDLKDGKNVNLVLANGSAKIGDYKIRSRCQKLGGFYGIVSDYLRVGPTGDAVKDPLKGTVTDWKQMSKVPIACLPQADCSPTEEGRSVLLNGGGTAADPFRICTLAHLDQMRGNVTASYKIMKDIDATSTSPAGWLPIASFKGTLNGNNRTIRGLYILALPTSPTFLGLFGFVSGPGVAIYDLKLTNVTVTGTAYNGSIPGLLRIGGLAGAFVSGTLNNVSVQGSITISGTSTGGSTFQVGLIVGYARDFVVDQCDVSGSVSVDVKGPARVGLAFGEVIGQGTSSISRCKSSGTTMAKANNASAGGLVGFLSYLTVSRSQSSGTVTAIDITNGGGFAGGLAGATFGSNFNDSFSTAVVTASSPSVAGGGGLVGAGNFGTINRSYASGNVAVTSTINVWAGTLSGTLNGGSTVTNSFGAGKLSYSPSPTYKWVGGLAGNGAMPDTVITNSYWYKNTGSPSGCVSAQWSPRPTCTSVTTPSSFYSSSVLPALFAGWDFATVWKFPGGAYPILQ